MSDSSASNVYRSAPSTLPSGPERAALCARIDAELADMDALTVSTWMLARKRDISPLRLREFPPFNFSLLPGRQFEIISALQKGDRSLAELARLVGGDEAQHSRELVALLLMGCLVLV